LGYGMGCQGVIEVFLEPPESAESLAGLMREVSEDRRERAFVLLIEGAHVGSGVTFTTNGTTSVSTDGIENAVEAARDVMRSGRPAVVTLPSSDRAFVEILRPPIRLALFGDRSDAPALAEAARALGWEVACVARSEPVPEDKLDARTFAVVMNHAYLTDGERLRALLDSSVPYIGMLGPRGRTERLLSLVDGHPGLDRVFGPAGLDLGAEGPQEIASSIVAEIIAVDRGRSGGSLRD